jgi:hypothetical protein
MNGRKGLGFMFRSEFMWRFVERFDAKRIGTPWAPEPQGSGGSVERR